MLLSELHDNSIFPIFNPIKNIFVVVFYVKFPFHKVSIRLRLLNPSLNLKPLNPRVKYIHTTPTEF